MKAATRRRRAGSRISWTMKSSIESSATGAVGFRQRLVATAKDIEHEQRALKGMRPTDDPLE